MPDVKSRRSRACGRDGGAATLRRPAGVAVAFEASEGAIESMSLSHHAPKSKSKTWKVGIVIAICYRQRLYTIRFHGVTA
jgi:hypothetical protein